MVKAIELIVYIRELLVKIFVITVSTELENKEMTSSFNVYLSDLNFEGSQIQLSLKINKKEFKKLLSLLFWIFSFFKADYYAL
jgi:hypothetical protein